MSNLKILHWEVDLQGAEFINISVNGWPVKIANGQKFYEEILPKAYPHLFKAVYEQGHIEPLKITDAKPTAIFNGGLSIDFTEDSKQEKPADLFDMSFTEKDSEKVPVRIIEESDDQEEDQSQSQSQSQNQDQKEVTEPAFGNVPQIETFTKFAMTHKKKECAVYLNRLNLTVIRKIATYYGLNSSDGNKKAEIIDSILGVAL